MEKSEQRVKKILQDVKKLEKTPFSEFDVSISDSLSGGPLRDRLGELTNLQSSIAQKVSWFAFKEKNAEARKKHCKSLAVKSFSGKKMTSVEKNYLSETEEVMIDEISTTYFDEMYDEVLFGYYATEGKYKLKELEKNLDIGRSLLSWDKAEIEKGL